MLVLAPDTLADLRLRARTAAPAECCGLLICGGTHDRAEDADEEAVFVTSIRPVPNDHEERYLIPPAEFVAAERAARAAGGWVCGVYHSHPAGDAVPSDVDRAAAWPGFVYVIIGRSDVRAWRLTDERHFREISIDMRMPHTRAPAGLHGAGSLRVSHVTEGAAAR